MTYQIIYGKLHIVFYHYGILLGMNCRSKVNWLTWVVNMAASFGKYDLMGQKSDKKIKMFNLIILTLIQSV